MADALTATEKSRANLIPFKPGQSGNPAGRPPGSRKTLLRRLQEAVEADDGAKAQRIVDRITQLAEDGEEWAAKLVWDRIEGPIRQQLDTRVTSDHTVILAAPLDHVPALPSVVQPQLPAPAAPTAIEQTASDSAPGDDS